MTIILFALALFLDFLFIFVIIDVVLSWLSLFWVRFRPRIFNEVLDPIYRSFKNNLPMTIGPFDFTPIAVLIVLQFALALIFSYSPDVKTLFFNLPF